MHTLNILSKAQINQVQDVSQKVTLHRPNSITKVRKPWRDINYLLLTTYYLLIITYYFQLITYYIIYHPYNGRKLTCTFPVITVEYGSQQQQQ